MKSLILGERNKLDKIKVLQVEKTDTQSSVDKIKAFSQSATLFVGDQLTCERIAGLIRLMEGEKDYHRFVPPSPTGTRASVLSGYESWLEIIHLSKEDRLTSLTFSPGFLEQAVCGEGYGQREPAAPCRCPQRRQSAKRRQEGFEQGGGFPPNGD